MAMTAASMATFIETAMAAISQTTLEGSDATADAQTRARSYLEALCKGIIDEIQANAVVTTDGPHSGTVA